MRALFLKHHFQDVQELDLPVVELPKPTLHKGQCLVRVHSSGVNPSDAKGTLGFFAHAKVPRILGRDFAGEVVQGYGVGKKVWGTGGAAGIEFDGTHAELIVIPEEAVEEIPRNLTLLQAGAQTLPYVTAYYALAKRARILGGEKVLVIGALGQVGQAAMSICKWKKCEAVALVREGSLAQAKARGWKAISSISSEYDVILNSVGSVYWEEGLKFLAKFGRMVIIGAGPDPKAEAKLPLLPFYRANQEILGINSVDLDYVQNAKLLRELKSGFESNELGPLKTDAVFSLENATEAYRAVLEKSNQRIVLSF